MVRLGYDYWFTFADWVDLCKLLQQTSDTEIVTPHGEFSSIMKTKDWCGKLSRREMQHDEVITDKAIEYIRSADEFFAVVSYYGPHPPYAAPPPFSEMYDPAEMTLPHTLGERTEEEWQQIKSQYYGCTSWIDDNIGRLLCEVSDDTIVIFTSDHGDILGDHGLFSKGYFGYEGNTRVPLIIRAPDMVNRTYEHISQHIDIAPTILTLLNQEVPQSMQGKSLLSSANSNTSVNEYALSMVGDDPKVKILRTGDTKYWLRGDDEWVYDLSGDPLELENIANELNLPSLRKTLIKAMIEAES
jgi:arylsulfatase A-like enzyme